MNSKQVLGLIPQYMKILASFILILFNITLNAQKMGSFTDDRDGQTYKTVTYQFKLNDTITAEMTWMAENLKFKIKDSYCYEDFESNCDIMGRLYKWEAARKACPQDWHLPNDKEWIILANLFGGVSLAGKHLKNTDSLWGSNQGTNKSLFSAMPYGNAVLGNGYYAFGINATFWSADENGNDRAKDWVLGDRDKFIDYKGHKLTTGNSVRCVKN